MNLPTPRLPFFKRGWVSHKQRFLYEGNRGGESSRKTDPKEMPKGIEVVLPGRAKGRGTGRPKAVAWKERAHLVSVALRTQLGPKGGWKVKVVGPKRFQLVIKAAQLEGLVTN